MENELKQLIKQEGEKITITSMDLCKLINALRKEEKGKGAKELRHANLMASIRSEIEVVKELRNRRTSFRVGVLYRLSKPNSSLLYILNDEGMCDCISVFKYYKINCINNLHKCLRNDYAIMNYKILCDISCLKSGYIFMINILYAAHFNKRKKVKTYVFMSTVL